MAVVQYFLRLGDITGESTVKGHEQEIEVLAFSWGVHTTSGSGGGGGGGGGKAIPDELSFLADSSIASPRIFSTCAQGKHLVDAVLTGRKKKKGNKGNVDFVVITLTDVIVSSFEITAGPDDVPEDEVTLAFDKLAVSFTSGPMTAEAGWDFAKSSPI
jgi:type VI secretion system secreted protein Hcp